MNVVLFGATGMVGTGALLECFADPRVRSVLAITRSTTGHSHPKLREIVHGNFFNYDHLAAEFASCDACFFCLGVSSLGMAANQRITFCYVSGVGTDSTERGRTMWARVKGKTENALLALPFFGAYMFRPGYIQPIGGVKSKTGWVQAAYTVLAPVYPILRPLLRGTTTANFGRALIQVAANGYAKRILYSSDINALAEAP
jgi:hypothetical protein